MSGHYDLFSTPIDPVTVTIAWEWLCHSRKEFPAHADIWNLRFHQATELPRILDDLAAGHYTFSAMQIITRADGEEVALWSAADALVLKILTLTLQPILPCHQACYHIQGHGGHKASVRQAHRWIEGGHYTFVCKTDIRGYYANIDKHHLLTLLSEHVKCPIAMNLLGQFMFYSVEKGGNFHEPRRGIPRGCPLSPLLAGFHLYELDCDLASRKGVRYLRFMDDLLILTRTRWQLKRAVATMNGWFTVAKLTQHPDKTFIGRIAHGFDWLGYQFTASGLHSVASRTVEHFETKLHRLFEQARRRGTSMEETRQQVVAYIGRWKTWASAGLPMIDRILDGLGEHSHASPWLVSTPAGMAVKYT